MLERTPRRIISATAVAALAVSIATESLAQLAVGGTPAAPLRKVSNSYRWLDSSTRDLTGLRLSNFDIAIDRNAIRITGGQRDVVIRDGVIRLTRPTTGTNLPVAIEVVDGSDVTIENVQAYGFRMQPVKGRYENGDCFSGERKSSNVTLRNTLASDCSDGGYDFKTVGLRLENTVAEDVGKGYRIWGQATATTITCRRWRDGCIQTNPGTAEQPSSITVEKLVLDPDPAHPAATIGVHKGSTVIVRSCEGRLASGKVIYWQRGADWRNTRVMLCGVEVTGQTDAELRAQIEARLSRR